MLFDRADLPFFESPVVVQPRSKKYVLVDERPRQYDAVVLDGEKADRIAARREYPNMMRVQQGSGGVYRTTLYAKLLLLALIKFATLDPLGMGVEMEAEKPAWCDALNGLARACLDRPCLRHLNCCVYFDFLQIHLPEANRATYYYRWKLLSFSRQLWSACKFIRLFGAERDFQYWDAVSTARESYRERIRLGFAGEEISVPFRCLTSYLFLFLDKVQAGIARALQLSGGIPPTYFTYEIEDYEILSGPDKKPLVDDKERSYPCPPVSAQGIYLCFWKARCTCSKS